MNKLLYFFIFIFLTSGCSFNKNSKFWTSTKNIPEEKKQEYKKIFFQSDPLKQELNSNIKFKLNTKIKSNQKKVKYHNNDGRLNYDGNLKKSSRYKFSKIKKFYQFEPTISFNKNNIVFFDNKGSILQFNDKSKLIWKKNYYSKSQKRLNPILQFANNEKYLIVADNIARYYMLNLSDGNLV